MLLFASLAVSAALALAPLTESAALDSPYRHVRTQDRSVRSLLKRGFTHSPTFARLMARLEQSDVLVYVEEVPRLPDALEGRMMMLPIAHGQRYVRIQLALRGAPDDSIAVLGHELQHAVEVAQEIGVQDEATLVALYQRIGTRAGPEVYDTGAAREVGRIVRRELLA
ncbi:MAG TPA: hypothetical protein VF921_13285 [Vicinamibacterales bacterium]